MHFKVRWPNGDTEACYSPSLVIKEFFAPGENYPLDDFLARSREALTIASERVGAKYGRPCSLALEQLAAIETKAARFAADSSALVAILAFEE
jgi:uncharacterized repeat protein (TIGR04042 family)